MTLWHKFLVCFTWAAPGYIWGTTFFAFHGLFHRHCHCPCHQWLCPQHHWWPGVFSVPDVAGTFAWGSQSGRCSCHMQGDLAWGPPDWCLVPWACMCHCIQEARAMYTTSSGTPRCSGAAGSAALAPLAPLPPYETSAHLQTYNCVYLWCPDVLDRKKKNFIYEWCYLQDVDWGEKQKECLLPP